MRLAPPGLRQRLKAGQSARKIELDPGVAASLNPDCADPILGKDGDLAGERTSGRKSLNSRQDHVSAGS